MVLHYVTKGLLVLILTDLISFHFLDDLLSSLNLLLLALKIHVYHTFTFCFEPIQVRNACHKIFKNSHSCIGNDITLILCFVLSWRIWLLWGFWIIFFNQRHFSQVPYFFKSFIFRQINIKFSHKIFSYSLWAFDWAQLFFFGMREGFFRTLVRLFHKCIVESLLNLIIHLHFNFVNAVIWSIWFGVHLIEVLKC